MNESRALVVSSFTIVKGSLIAETYSVFRAWDFGVSKFENLRRVREENTIGATSANWARDVAKVINRRFDPDGRDRTLVLLAKAGCPLETWKPLMLWHMTRDEFLVRDFLTTWLYARFQDGTYRLHVEDVLPYLSSLADVEGVVWSGSWTEDTASRVASGLLRIAADFGVLQGSQNKEFASYHLPDDAFLYLLYAMSKVEHNPRRLIDSKDWRMYLMDAAEVEHGLLRLHQFDRLHFDSAGSIAHLQMQRESLDAYVEEITA